MSEGFFGEVSERASEQQSLEVRHHLKMKMGRLRQQVAASTKLRPRLQTWHAALGLPAPNSFDTLQCTSSY